MRRTSEKDASLASRRTKSTSVFGNAGVARADSGTWAPAYGGSALFPLTRSLRIEVLAHTLRSDQRVVGEPGETRCTTGQTVIGAGLVAEGSAENRVRLLAGGGVCAMRYYEEVQSDVFGMQADENRQSFWRLEGTIMALRLSVGYRFRFLDLA